MIRSMDLWRKQLEQWEIAHIREERRKMGQIWTPDDLGQWMAAWLLEKKPKTILDPACGPGALLAPFDGKAAIYGADIDDEILGIIKERFPSIETWNDFLTPGPLQEVEAITCNPPYLKSADIPNRKHVQDLVREKVPLLKMPGSANLAIAFLALCHAKLRSRGRMLFLMPTEFMQIKSGAPVKRWLLDHAGLIAVVDLDDSSLFGDDVISTACLVLIEKDAMPDQITFAHHTGRGPFPDWKGFLESAKKVDRKDVDPDKRWRRHIRGKDQISATKRLGDYAQVKAGHITGKNGLFLKSWGEIKKAGLEDCAVYCVVRPHQLPTPYSHSKDQIKDLKYTSQRRWMISLPQKPVKPEHLKWILDAEIAKENNSKTLIARSPWWLQKVDQPGDFWVSNFRRNEYLVQGSFAKDGLLQRLDAVCIPNLVRVKPAYKKLKEVIFGIMVSTSGQKALQSQERHAGNGLYTVRSGALKEVPLPDLSKADPKVISKMKAAIADLAAAAEAKNVKDLEKARIKIDALAELLYAKDTV